MPRRLAAIGFANSRSCCTASRGAGLKLTPSRASSWTVSAQLACLLLVLKTAPVWSAVPSPPAATQPVAAPATSGDASSGRLTLDEAVRIGMAQNPQIAAGVAGAASAERNYRSLAAFPPINLGLTHVLGSSSAPTLNGTTTDTFADLGETVDTSGQRRFQAAGAKAQWAAARSQLEETELTLSQQIRDAYWSLAAARAQAEIARQSLQDAQRVYQLTQTQFEAGSSPRVDVIRSSIDVANVQQSAISAQGAERAAVIAFNVLLARSAANPVELADQLAESTPTPAATGLPNLTDLTRKALAQRPLVQSARAQVRAAEYALKQARAARFPDLTVDYQRSLQQPVYSVLLGITLPLLDFGSVHNSVKAAEESKKQAVAQQQQAEQQVRQQVAQAHTDFTLAQQLAASYQTDILSPSVTLLSSAQLGYKQGATGILPVIDAETTLRNARNGYISSLLALYKAQDELLAATGDLPLPALTHPH
jgi:outer membrane protein TolC